MQLSENARKVLEARYLRRDTEGAAPVLVSAGFVQTVVFSLRVQFVEKITLL
jgi:hypothetical protein